MFGAAWRRENKALIERKAYLIDLNLKVPPDLDDFFLKYKRKEGSDEGNVVRLAPGPVPERPRPNVDELEEDLGLDGENDDTQRQADAEEGWIDDVQQNMALEAGEDRDVGELDAEDETRAHEELNPHTVAPGTQAGTPQATNPIAMQSAAAPEINPAVIDPVLRGEMLAATLPAQPTLLPVSRPKAKPKPRPPPTDNPPPAPSSSIRIRIPVPKDYIAPLPQPHPNHSATRSSSPTLPSPVQAIQAKPTPLYEPQVPQGGPPYRPPPLAADPPNPPLVEPDLPSKKSTRKENEANTANMGPAADQGGAGGSSAAGGKKEKGGKGGKGGEVVAPAAGDGVEPAAPKRRSRPPKASKA
ncbi:hypothetical protein FRC10_009057 [Ceratobasidium sp. 414]|nr:hypothetical protein FRC10_009057 [Ceratobasidium sp. 414]